MTKLTDELLKRIKSGDNEPLGEVFIEHFDYCTQALVNYNKCSIDDAKDVYMDAIQILRDKIIKNQFVDQNMRGFLLTVAKNKLKNKRIKDQRHLEFNIEKVEAYLFEKKGFGNDAKNNLSSDQQYKVDAILCALKQINDKCQKLIYRHYYEGFSLSELQKELGYGSYASIKTTIDRCRKKLNEIIKNAIGHFNTKKNES